MPDRNYDVIDLLLAQHDRIKDTLHQVQLAVGTDKQQWFDELVRLLAVHESAEGEVVHPASRRHTVSDDIVEDRLHEEANAKQTLVELHELGVDHPEFNAKFGAFAYKVVEHAEAEEKQEFAQLLAQTSAAERAQLASAVRFAESVAPARPHPGVGQAPPAKHRAWGKTVEAISQEGRNQ
ncbi:hemerythrin domain-containing protein [Nocardia tengchongensis]|uniref:Hemerythrin domain-containing protein n=1 Tax=Nocardia tengchongensis TaxID=2055889 RepID=A0ABX8CIL2_9NOCA|nr:hemerythrin domain-containing protein [Nocardia tengchongensis]QVI19806.1 hemerythrin domain-containing protein [Nocardia tengchongensis]